MVAESALRVVVVATDGDCRAVGEADARDENSTTGMVPRCSFACGSSITASIRTPSLTDWTSILRVELVAIGTFANLLSRRSRNQKGVRRLSNNQPRLSRAVLDDPPIHIRPNCSRQSGCKGKNPLDLSHDGPTILPKNISAATPICAKNITSHSVRD